jgi:small subunit ribosomal protein S19
MVVEIKSQEAITRSKDVYYRGKNVEELKKLDVREVAKYLDSRCRRSVLRHFDVIEKFVKRCETSVASKKKIKTHLRDIIVVPRLVGMTISIYNGKLFNDITVTAEMIGHRLGEFSPTRSKVQHGEAGIGATKGSKALKK